MIYLIIDTCNWIYLASGFDTQLSKIDIASDRHINVFEQIKDKSLLGEFKVLVNDIILSEWERNKKSTQQRIFILETERKLQISNLVNAKLTLSPTEFKSKCADVNQFFREKIENANIHIDEVEAFLNSCPKYEISDELKLEIAELAINKEKAPFQNNKNNAADAAILFGAVDFLKENQKEHIEKAVFASANFRDFGISKASNEFHPDIKSRLTDLHLEYHQNWKNLLGLTEDLQYEIDLFHEYIRDSNQYFSCLSGYCESKPEYSGFGYLDRKIRLSKPLQKIDPDQLLLFNLESEKNNFQRFVRRGNCVICHSEHIECPDCESLLIDINGSDQFYCDNCEQIYETGTDQYFGDIIIYPINEEDIHL